MSDTKIAIYGIGTREFLRLGDVLFPLDAIIKIDLKGEIVGPDGTHEVSPGEIGDLIAFLDSVEGD